MSGETMVLSKYKFDNEQNLLLYKDKRFRLRDIDRDYIFSITDSTGNEKVIYSPDTLERRSLSIENMRNFIKGEQFAHKDFKAIGSFFTGFAIANTNPFIFKRFFWYLLIPAATSVGSEVIPISKKKVLKRCSGKSDNKYFLEGYREVAGRKRFFHATIGAGAGLITGIIIAIIFGNDLQICFNDILR